MVKCHVKVDQEHRQTLVLFFIPLAKNSNCFPYKLCVWMPQGYFCACQPSFRMMRRLPNTIPHGHICCKIWFCRCQIARIFTLKSVGQFTARASYWQFFTQEFPKSLIFAIYRRWASPHHSLASPAKRTLTTRATFPDLSKPRRSSSSEGSAERTGSEPNKVSCQRQQWNKPEPN